MTSSLDPPIFGVKKHSCTNALLLREARILDHALQDFNEGLAPEVASEPRKWSNRRARIGELILSIVELFESKIPNP